MELLEKWKDSSSAFENRKASLMQVSFFLSPLKFLFWPEKNCIDWSFHDSMKMFFMSLHQEEAEASQLFLPTVIFNKINNSLIDLGNVISNGWIWYCACGIRVCKSHILTFLNIFVYNYYFLILKHYLQLSVDFVK